MKKKSIFLILISILLLILILPLCLSKKEHQKSLKNPLDNKIISNKVQNKNMLIYLYNNDSKECYDCKDITKIIKFYDEFYNLDFIYYDKNKTTTTNYKELEEKIGIDNINMAIPAIIYFKGESIYTINSIFSEAIIKDFLEDNKLITTNRFNNIIYNKEQFEKIYNSNENKLLIYHNNEKDSYNFRKKVYNYSKIYNFDVYNMNNGTGNVLEAYINIYSQLEDKLSVPMLIILKEKKVIDYTNNENEIENFLKKYNYIN